MTVYQVGDRVVTKKPHPCGGSEWLITRTGADIKIKCEKCGHTVMIPLADFGKRVKKHFPAGEVQS